MYQYYKQHRLPGYPYTKPNFYFVTICTKYKSKDFGYIQNSRICLSEIDSIVHKAWLEIPQHFPQVTLDQFIVMPDHVHGLIQIKSVSQPVGTCYSMYPQNSRIQLSQFSQPIAGSLSMIINSFKGAITRGAHAKGHWQFRWQSRFHDRIIRSHIQLMNVRHYILTNPSNWKQGNGHIYNLDKIRVHGIE